MMQTVVDWLDERIDLSAITKSNRTSAMLLPGVGVAALSGARSWSGGSIRYVDPRFPTQAEDEGHATSERGLRACAP